jgi:simple sugar transport system permease protein
VAVRLLDYLLSTGPFLREGRTDPLSPPVHGSAELPTLGTFHLGILVALAAAVGFGYLVWRTSTGFRLRMVGISTSAARYAGIDVGVAWMLAMALAGMLGGLAGATYLLGQQKSVRGGFPGFGFDGIALALLGRTKPAGVVMAAFLFGVLRAGSVGMQAKTDVPVDLIVVIQALIVVFVAAPALIRGIWRVRTPETSGLEHVSTGWGS